MSQALEQGRIRVSVSGATGRVGSDCRPGLTWGLEPLLGFDADERAPA